MTVSNSKTLRFDKDTYYNGELLYTAGVHEVPVANDFALRWIKRGAVEVTELSKEEVEAKEKAEKEALKAKEKADKEALKAKEKADKEALKAQEKADKEAKEKQEKEEKEAKEAAEKLAAEELEKNANSDGASAL